MDDHEDKRQRLRIAFETKVELCFEPLGTTLVGKMKNISMSGLFIKTDQKIGLRTPCVVKAVIDAANSRLTMETRGMVIRHAPDGMGIEFEEDMEWLALFSIFEHYGRPAERNNA